MDRVYLSKFDKIYRGLWIIFHAILIRYSPVSMFKYRSFVYRLWGADVDKGGFIYPSTTVWDPRNLRLAVGACIGPHVNVYNVCQVSVGENALISQFAYLCTASHDFSSEAFYLIGAPIVVDAGSWVCADCFIGPSVTIGEKAVCLARSVVVKNVEEQSIVGGNPSKNVGSRNGAD